MNPVARTRAFATTLLVAAAVSCLAGIARADSGGMTGEILTLLYVTDVRESVEFYEALGFDHYYYYDYKLDEYVLEWTSSYPPEYAEMTSGAIRIGLTTADEPDPVYGGGVRHYFIVDEVENRFARVKEKGVVPTPDEVERRPWMDFFTTSDPDGHQIVFGRKNQAYYDRIAKQLEAMRNSSD